MSERSSTSSRPREMRLSVERRLSDTSLREDSPRSPSFSRNGFLSPTRENFEDVDLGASVPLPVSPITSPIPIDEIPRPRSRLLTRSPSPSPDQRANTPAQSNEQDPTPIRRPSSALSNLSQTSQAPDQLQLASSSGLSSPTHTPSPPPRFINFKPALPSATIALDGHVDGVDPTAPFENISLTSTPPLPPLPASPTIVGSPESTRGSWKSPKNGTSGQQSFASSSSVHLPSSPRPSGSQNGDPKSRNGSMTGESPQPRLHAPPAHPHPFPLPGTLSPSVENKGAKDQSTIPQKGQPSVPAALGVKGTSTFEKVISHTRPSWLPPKDKTEDEIHYHQWEDMMSQAREQEKERKKQAEIRRLEREKRMTANMSRWEDLMRTGFSSEKVQTDPSLRQLWFEGVPSHLRGKAWSLAVGNPLAMSKDAYRSYLARAKRSMETERFPADILEQLERDMDGTLPTLRLYVRGSPMRDDLREFICAWVVYRSDEGLGYAPYITHLAAMFLLNAPPAQAFLSLVNLLARPCMRAFYTDTIDEIDAYYRVFENLQADLFPKIFANCKNLGLKLPESYFRSMFIEQVPFETCCRLWDQIILDGDGYIFRAALAIFGFLEPRLHYPDKDEIASVLEGRNKATQAIVERERARAKLKGEAYIEALDGTLSVFGLSEEPLFDWLADDGWKESRFERLVTRELPD